MPVLAITILDPRGNAASGWTSGWKAAERLRRPPQRGAQVTKEEEVTPLTRQSQQRLPLCQILALSTYGNLTIRLLRHNHLFCYDMPISCPRGALWVISARLKTQRMLYWLTWRQTS